VLLSVAQSRTCAVPGPFVFYMPGTISTYILDVERKELCSKLWRTYFWVTFYRSRTCTGTRDGSTKRKQNPNPTIKRHFKVRSSDPWHLDILVDCGIVDFCFIVNTNKPSTTSTIPEDPSEVALQYIGPTASHSNFVLLRILLHHSELWASFGICPHVAEMKKSCSAASSPAISF
jgi:hypothetical protein